MRLFDDFRALCTKTSNGFWPDDMKKLKANTDCSSGATDLDLKSMLIGYSHHFSQRKLLSIKCMYHNIKSDHSFSITQKRNYIMYNGIQFFYLITFCSNVCGLSFLWCGLPLPMCMGYINPTHILANHLNLSEHVRPSQLRFRLELALLKTHIHGKNP